jgi:hypothetical protein
LPDLGFEQVDPRQAAAQDRACPILVSSKVEPAKDSMHASGFIRFVE